MPASHAFGEYPVASPGAHLVSTVMAGNGQPFQCTSGFTVRTPGGAPAMLTAGHCRRDPANDTVIQRTPMGDRVIGRYVRSEVQPGVHDMGLVDLAGSTVPLVSDVDAMRVTRVMTADDVRREQPQLCKSGARTGLSCGPVTAVTDTQVSFRAWDDLGDSGAPVYARQPDGTAAAVGILYAHTDDAFGRIVHASLVAPVMNQWGLSLWS
ncbi:S1 family peptidase [Mycolicibacterium litorale]|nr:S1 family peptidase [Mycolicibacterium litorale]